MAEARKGRILIVDDQEGIRESMAGILEIEGYEIFSCEDGYKAIEKVKAEPVDVAFLDVKMPGINGVDTFRAIKKLRPETVVFMMTAYAEEELVKQALDEGAYACIHKPFEMERILEIVQTTQQKTAVLIVDNQMEMLEFLRSSLMGKGYRVLPVSDIAAAAETLARSPVDIVLLDTGESGVDEREMLRRIGEMTGDEGPNVVMIRSVDVPGPASPGIAALVRKTPGAPLDIAAVEKTIRDLVAARKKTPKPSVLVVDNDPALGRELSALLSGSGYDVKVVTTGRDAINEMKAERCKVVLLNAELPDTDGVKLYDEIRAIQPETGVVIMTANAKDEAIINAVRQGNYTCLNRPFEPERMLEIIRKVCAANRSHRSAP